MNLAESYLTHEVANQPPPLECDLYGTDVALQEALHREGGGWGEDAVGRYGRIAGGELMALGYAANAQRPQLKLYDRYGHRLDEVEFHPAYHRIMELGATHGVAAWAWRHEAQAGAHVARAALCYLHNQAEQGTSCPLTMTYASVPALRTQAELAREWLPRIMAMQYDPRSLPAADKRGVTIGMGMTEKQGGSDVRSNTTKAVAGGADGRYELVGHKWFFSAPMSDAFLVLAQAPGGISCFLLPRLLPDGRRNAVRIQRLKDKLGNWSNASSEVEFCGAEAWLLGGEGRGIATILEMVSLTRLDCMIGSAALMRQALVQALHHTRHRRAFGRLLSDQALMRNVLADLALESEAAIALVMRVARAVDRSRVDAGEAAFARIATAIGKYWICKRCVPAVNEAQECLGGIGYVEETLLPRLYREAPVNSIWEGSGNIQCLDVLRALAREPEALAAFWAECQAAQGAHPALDAELRRLHVELADRSDLECRSRWLVERMALCLQGSLLLRAGNAAVAHAFCESRLAQAHGLNFGTLRPDVPFDLLLARAFPSPT